MYIAYDGNGWAVANQRGELNDSHRNYSVVGARDYFFCFPVVGWRLYCHFWFRLVHRRSARLEGRYTGRLDFWADRARIDLCRHPFAQGLDPPSALAAPAACRSARPKLIQAFDELPSTVNVKWSARL